ncbi:CFEM domain-containing protein [Colletotrichum musicola]|uniref:CFEM domain-containing protein n=1 Tax=Colletotrichum musicola TaxID=2175873 RepID=A0A8H6K1E1_9PEZI|nr:CFEM domain-containing protein [Colletotrichum musicola]
MKLKSFVVWIGYVCSVLGQNASGPAEPSQPSNDTLTFPACAVANSICQTVDNTTCVCHDQGFYKQVESCVMAGCTPPEGIAAQKAKADYCHDPIRSQVTMLYGLRSLEIAAWFLVLFRFYARRATQLSFGRDDYVMMAVAAIYIPQLVISQLMDDNAFGRDIWNVEWDKILLGLKLFFVQEPLYLLQLGLTKISILFLYLRIFPGRKFRIITYTFMWFVALTTLGLAGGSVIECLPIGYFWDAWRTEYLIHTKKCVNLTVAVFAAAGVSIFQDIIMIILPIPPLMKTQIPKKDKIGISVMFILGLLITGASCFRLQYVNVAYSPNPFWDFEPALLWSLVELAMSFLVTSLPALYNYYTRIVKPKFRAYMESRYTTKTSHDSSTGPGGRPGQNNLRSQLRSRLGRRAAGRGNNNLISTLFFTRVSWKSWTDRKTTSQMRDGVSSTSPTDDGDLARKSAPRISLRELDGATELCDGSWGPFFTETPRVINEDLETERENVHALAWVGRTGHATAESNG